MQRFYSPNKHQHTNYFCGMCGRLKVQLLDTVRTLLRDGERREAERTEGRREVRLKGKGRSINCKFKAYFYCCHL